MNSLLKIILKEIIIYVDRGRVGAGAPEHNHPHIMEHQDSQVRLVRDGFPEIA